MLMQENASRRRRHGLGNQGPAGRADDIPSALPASQPLPRVEPALDFAGLLDELDASVRPALLSDAFEGFPDDRDDFAMVRSFLRWKSSPPEPEDMPPSSRRDHLVSRVE
jgi:hypothetical protein